MLCCQKIASYLTSILLRYLQYQSYASSCISCLVTIQFWLTLPVPAEPWFPVSCIASSRAAHWCVLGPWEHAEGRGSRWAALSPVILHQATHLLFPCSQAKLLPMWCPQGSPRILALSVLLLFSLCNRVKQVSALRHCNSWGIERKGREWNISAFNHSPLEISLTLVQQT